MNKEFLHMQKLAGVITEGEYKEKLQTVREAEGLDVDDNKLDKIEDKIKSELDKNEDLKKLAMKALKSLQDDTGLSLKDMANRKKVSDALTLNEISGDQISKATSALFTMLSASSGLAGAGMKIVGVSHANPALIIAALAAGAAAYLWNYKKLYRKK